MAGRGTDIRLGCADPGDYQRICALGGLYVIGTNRHESRRIDNQLRGRAGRQGDPGSSCFYVSLQDDLMQQYGLVWSLPRQIEKQALNEPLNNALVHGEIERAQRIIEDQNFQIRQTLTRYSKMVEDQRQIVSARRHQVLTDGDSLCLFEERLPDLYQRLCASVGRDRIFQIEKRVTLFHMDNATPVVFIVGFVALAISRNVILHSIVVPTFLLLLIGDVIIWHPSSTAN